jgi:ABC-2 type transport system ATP-binding protein
MPGCRRSTSGTERDDRSGSTGIISGTMSATRDASMNPAAIETQGLRKTYGRTVALDGLDLRVGEAEVFGLLGPNGAGKTTAVKLLLGLARASSGTGIMLGRPLGDREARRRIGYLPELFRYQPWLTAREVLALHCELAGLARHRWVGEIDRSLSTVGLKERGSDRVGGFSKGMQQRLGLGVALLGEPAVVILDEPTSALDPVGREDVRSIVREAKEHGTSVVLNSHLLGEVERLCDRVAILHRGRLLASGGLSDLLGEPALRLRVTGIDGEVDRVLGPFGPVASDGEWLVIRPLPPERVPDVVAAVVAAGGRVHAVDPGRRTLEEAFLDLVRPTADSAV